MKTNMREKGRGFSPSQNQKGFTLIELLVAMAVFVILAGAAFSLFGKHEAYAMRQEGLSGLNIGLRNAMSQMQMDLSGAGQNLLAGVQSAAVTPFSVGVIIQNNAVGTAPACTPNTTTWAYPVPSACFDGFTIIKPKPCVNASGAYAPVLVMDDPANGENLAVSSIMFATDPNNPNSATTLSNDAGCFSTGDEVLVVQPNNTANPPTCGSAAESNYCMTVVTLTKDSQSSGNKIQVQHNPTGATGGTVNCPGSGCTDPLGLVYNSSGSPNFSNALGPNFSNGAFIVDLGTGGNDISYAVQTNPSDPSDQQLIRCIGTLATCVAGNGQVVTDEVIGFKVGAALWGAQQASGVTDIASYFYNAADYCNGGIQGANCDATPPPANDPYDFSLIRSIRISMIARTKPHSSLAPTNFDNGFDNGPYLIQQGSVAVDIRNMSINDFGN